MTIPTYQGAGLPRITFPFGNTQRASKRYLGGIAITGAVYLDVNITAVSDAEEKALYNFWKDDINYGLEPFLIAIPTFGDTVDADNPSLLVQFVSDLSSALDGNLWKTKIKLKVYGTIDYIVDDFGDFIVADTGEYIVTEGGDYIPTGNIINSYREVLYGN